ncbi:BNR repeat-containing protein [Paenibacillus sp. GCM10027626]|uniref:BNR repeat-containing protein n=1 Tax=Paenibacillus sp. GCM10027626 TaxID=3273411 RepID=UPI00364565AD
MVKSQIKISKLKHLHFLLIIALFMVSVIPTGMVQTAAAAPKDELSWTDDFNRPDSNDVGNGWAPLRGDWSIGGNTLQTNGGPAERVIAQTGFELGKTFAVEATLRNTDYGRWNGVAFNITDNGDGTQDYYTLRMVTYPDQRPATWQLLQVTSSVITGAGLIASGAVPVEVGKDYTVRVSSSSDGELNVAIFEDVNPLLDRSVVLPLGKLLAGGYAGIYSLGGKLQVSNVRITISNDTNEPGNPNPDELSWTDNFNRPDSNDVGNGWAPLRGDWSIGGKALRTNGGPADRVIAQTGFELGKTFVVEATLRNTDYGRWNGVAFNITDNGDGTHDYYTLRMVTYPDQRPAAWQLLQVTGSTIKSESLIVGGTVPLEVNKDYTIRVSSSSYGVVDFSISEGADKLLDRSEVIPLDKLLLGGYAGFYSYQGSLQVSKVRITRSVMPPVAPVSGNLVWTPAEGAADAYENLDNNEVIIEKSVIDTTWAGHYVGQALLTNSDDQYVAYYNANRQMVVAHRKLGDDTWVLQPLDTFVQWDSHNYVTMAVDRAGQLHVSGNMHDVPLVYFRTTTAGDVTTLTRIPNMVDPASETKVTYPFFLRTSDGGLIFRHRNGSSGNGVDLYNIYNEETQQWQRLLEQPLHDGEGLRSAYVDGPMLGPDGYYHMVWVWRDSPNAATNQHLSYARSLDLVHWEKSDGTPLTLPITYSSSEVIDKVPMNGGILNGNTKIGFDAQGRVMVSYHKFDPLGNTQIYIARLTNEGWTINQISNWEGRWMIWGGGSLITEVTVGRVSVLPDDNLRLDFSVHGLTRTWVLHPDSLRPIAEINTPQLPSELTSVRSDFPEMGVYVSADLGSSGNEQERYILRRESLSQNRDQPRNPPLPDPVPLEVYHLRAASKPNPDPDPNPKSKSKSKSKSKPEPAPTGTRDQSDKEDVKR